MGLSFIDNIQRDSKSVLTLQEFVKQTKVQHSHSLLVSASLLNMHIFLPFLYCDESGNSSVNTASSLMAIEPTLHHSDLSPTVSLLLRLLTTSD